jgi:hypothetical protein
MHLQYIHSIILVHACTNIHLQITHIHIYAILHILYICSYYVPIPILYAPTIISSCSIKHLVHSLQILSRPCKITILPFRAKIIFLDFLDSLRLPRLFGTYFTQTTYMNNHIHTNPKLGLVTY